MLHQLRLWGSRVFACWILCVAFMPQTLESLRSTAPSSFYAAEYMSSSSIPTPHTRVSPPRRRITIKKPSQAVMCLAQTLYFEAAHEPDEGIMAVAATVFNRMNLRGQYPSSVCGVVYQPFQYSWTLDTSNWARTPPEKFFTLAKEFLSNRAIISEEYPVTHFHRIDIEPAWSHTLTYVVTVGQHKFYGL